MVVCPNTTVEFTCSVQTNVLTWIVPTDINSNDDSKLMLVVISTFPDPDPMGIYTASLIEGNLTYLLSSLSFITPIDSTNSDKDIVCVVGSDDSGPSCSFSIEGMRNEVCIMVTIRTLSGEPSPPINPVVVAVGVDSVNMTWSTSNCIDYYTVTVSNDSSVVVQTHTTNLTSILINGLQQGMNYSFTVKAVDVIGREGNASEYVTLLLDGKIFKTLKTIINIVS